MLMGIGICAKLELTVHVKVQGGPRHDGAGIDGVGDTTSNW